MTISDIDLVEMYEAFAAQVVPSYRELAEQRAAELPGAVGVGIDLLEPGAPRRLADAAQALFGAVDVLALNSGGPPTGGARDQDLDTLLGAVQRLLLPRSSWCGCACRAWCSVAGAASSRSAPAAS